MKEGLDCLRRLYDVTHISDIVADELQEATVCMVQTDHNLRIELVAGPKVEGLVRQGISLYHTAFEVANIQSAITELTKAGAAIVSTPKPAPLFGGQLVAFLSTVLGLIELVECHSDRSTEAGDQQSNQKESNRILVGATFTAEPLADVLEFWLREMGKESSIVFMPYGQIFQQLLDEKSLVAQKSDGVNALLIRMSDLLPAHAIREEIVDAAITDFARAVCAASDRNPVPFIVCICPSPGSDNKDREKTLRDGEQRLATALSYVHNVYVISHEQLFEFYPVEKWSDPVADATGNVPYSGDFFVALGTMIIRVLYSLTGPPRKVIVLDCDNTLWTGVCAEDGVDGVIIDEHRRSIQEFLLERYQHGMLLCLCSKNLEADVFAVFDRPEMILRMEHLAAHRINWKPKHENFRGLADELRLSYENFVFLDDDPIECASVADRCPGVLSFKLPCDAGIAVNYVRHLWVLDVQTRTIEDRNRNQMYREEGERQASRRNAFSFQEFYAKLNLVVTIESLSMAHLARAAQLTQRTNQFNINPHRRNESELARIIHSRQHLCRVVRVSDRFGDYGVVGFVVLTIEPPLAWTDTFLISCRALGRGVEHQILASIAKEAFNRGCNTLEIRHVETPRNTAARAFLQEILPPGANLNNRKPVQIPMEVATSIEFRPTGVPYIAAE
jgi:FkbH-like protein